MIVLSNGYQLPQTDDSGAEFFPALEYDIQRLNDHNHDGDNSERLTAAASVVIAQSIAASWSLISSGLYRQLITLPGALLFNEISIQIRLSTGEIIYPSIVPVSTTTYYIYVNDNTLALQAVYST